MEKENEGKRKSLDGEVIAGYGRRGLRVGRGQVAAYV